MDLDTFAKQPWSSWRSSARLPRRRYYDTCEEDRKFAAQTIEEHVQAGVLQPVPAGSEYIILPVFTVPTLELSSTSEQEPVLSPQSGPRAGRTWDRLLHTAGARS